MALYQIDIGFAINLGVPSQSGAHLLQQISVFVPSSQRSYKVELMLIDCLVHAEVLRPIADLRKAHHSLSASILSRLGNAVAVTGDGGDVRTEPSDQNECRDGSKDRHSRAMSGTKAV